MGLTLEKAQMLERVGLVKHFLANQKAWTAAAQEAYTYIKTGFAGEQVRPDDVIQPLKSVVEVDKSLRTFLNTKKLTQKYLIVDFTNLILDRTWVKLK